MAIAALVKVNTKPLNLKQSLPTQLPHFRFPSDNAVSFITQATIPNAVKLISSGGGGKCFLWKQPPPVNYHLSFEYKETPANPSPLQFVADVISKALQVLKTPAIAAVLFGALLMYDPNSALAASAGRMGGSSSSSRGGKSSSYRSSSSYISSSSSSSVLSSSMSEFLIPVFATAAVMLAILFFVYLITEHSEEETKKSVVKLQVGLLGTAQSLQMDLNQIAKHADTSTRLGWHYILRETVLALSRHPDYFISGYSSVNVKRGSVENLFNRLSREERGKVGEETLVNVNNIRTQSTQCKRDSGISNKYIVITIIAAAKGVHELPTINGNADLKEALQKLGSITSEETLAVEVLWTPQQENDILSEQEVVKNYPLLRPF